VCRVGVPSRAAAAASAPAARPPPDRDPLHRRQPGRRPLLDLASDPRNAATPTTPRKNRSRRGFFASANREGHKIHPNLQYRSGGFGFLVAIETRTARDEESDTRPRIPHDMSKKGKYVICTLALESGTRPDEPPLASKTVVMPANKPTGIRL
jgi:hypothetical protein